VLDQEKHRHADQSDMLHDCTAEEESDKGDKLQALIGVFLQLLTQAHRYVKSSEKHCNLPVGCFLLTHIHNNRQRLLCGFITPCSCRVV